MEKISEIIQNHHYWSLFSEHKLNSGHLSDAEKKYSEQRLEDIKTRLNEESIKLKSFDDVLSSDDGSDDYYKKND